jgi:hypothetical protein
MTDDTARARAAFEKREHTLFDPIVLERASDDRYLNGHVEYRWQIWLAAWSSRAPAQDERADAERFRWLLGKVEAHDVWPLGQTARFHFFWISQRTPMTIDPDIRALIDADRDREGAR